MEHRVAARETVEDARVPGAPNVPFTLKGRPVLDGRMPGWKVSQRQHCLVHDDGSLVLHVDRGATALSVYVRYLSTGVFEGRSACSRLQRLAHQGEDVVPIQPTGKEVPGARVGPPVPVPRQEVLWILREGSHASSRDVQQQVVCLVGIGRSHVAFVASIEHPNADGGIGRCEPE